MKCLVVISHPLSDSLCRHLADKAIQRLTEHGHDVIEENLYAQDYDPALSRRERQTYYGAYD